ncbi:MAG: ferritin-like domain-containing protein [Ilumatobacteraceae bacterium]
MSLPAATTPPSTADVASLAFANAAEWAARDLYSVAAGLSAFSDEEKSVLVGFHDHHRAAAQALGGLIGSDAPNVREDAVYNAFRSRLSGSDKGAIYDALRELENTLVATHTSLVGTLDGTSGSALVASIITVQARHAASLALLAARSLDDALVNEAVALTPGAES